ncbi:MAG: hypothetical protein F6J93_33595, partial [Oscillatoria sp. SIO1A7]|nr:hypothetical protein [Oscillatoria sp. SIO1A7]
MLFPDCYRGLESLTGREVSGLRERSLAPICHIESEKAHKIITLPHTPPDTPPPTPDTPPPTPDTRHPTPDTRHPTPHTLPHTPHPTPHTLHPKPHTPHPHPTPH